MEGPVKEKLTRERAGLLSVFTRIENNIRRLLQLDDASEEHLNAKFESISALYEKLVNKTVFWKSLLGDDPEDEAKLLDDYLAGVYGRLDKLKSDFHDWKYRHCDDVADDDVKPEDSASQVPSAASKASFLIARKSVLRVQAEANEKKYALQMKQLELQKQQDALRIETELAVAEAEEKAFKANSVTSYKSRKRASQARNSTVQHCVEDPKENKSPRNDELANAVGILQLPKVELSKFDGDPLTYWSFIRSFNNSVDSANVSYSMKLNLLLQYTTGVARNIIECCVVMEPEQGYTEAKLLLSERFGNHHHIAKAWVEKVTTGPLIKYNDAAELRRFADTVMSCMVTLKAMNRLCEVDSQSRMKLIVDKLPPYLQGSWRTRVVRILKASGEYPIFEDLVEFIQEAADAANDPVFGLNTDPKDSKIQKKRSCATFAVQTVNDAPRKSCRCCPGIHPLHRCELFKSKTLADRHDFTKQNRLCFNCFSANHMSRSCPRKSNCGVNNCNRKHSNLLHKDPDSQTVKTPILQSSVYGVSTSCQVALPIVPVDIKSDNLTVRTFALLDPGSTNTFCSRKILDSLALDGIDTTLSLNTLTCTESKTSTKLVNLDVMDSSGRFSMLMRNVIVVGQLPDLKGNIVSPDYLEEWPHLKDIKLPDMREMKVGLLIGQDNPQALIPMEVRSGNASEPYATRTVYGWAINGPVRYLKNFPIRANMVCVNKDLETAVEKFWDLERIDTTDGKLQMSREDKGVLDLWNASIETEDGHYKLPIPFKEQDPILPNNYPVADSRLSSLGRKLLGSEEMRQKYAAGIQDLVMKGYAEKVAEDQLDCPEGPVWYIPHHVVLNENKPDKFRIVFDCSAKFHNVSLNSKVLQGPDLTNSLIGVLLRFRENRIAISSDIESMFLQVRITDQHRDAVRFLWFKDDDPTQVPQVYRMKSHLFGGVWSSSVANYAVRRAAEDYGQQYDNLTVETVLENFYVDDCLKSVPSEQTAIKLIANVCELLQKGGFRLTKWISNSRSVLQTVPVSERGKELKNVDLCSDVLPQDKALGLKWDTETDTLGFKYKLKDKPPTKRGLISVISSVYDPLGFLCPLVLTAKIIFQNETRLRKDWDAPIADVNLKKWNAWITKLSQMEHFSIPRCIIPSGCEEAELNHFADASADGYGAVAYLRLKNSNGEVSCAFLFAKSRLAPIKSVTIPRLELSAAVLSVEIDKLLRTELRVDLSTSTFWTDSCIVLHYIKNHSHRYQTFVANRVAKICEASSPSQWRHVESSLNPADFASRGLDADELVAKHTWINGPDFLRNSEDEWPTNLVPDDVPAENLEIRKPKVNMVDAELDESCIDRLMKRHSSLYGLKKAVSWLLRLKNVF